MNISPKPGDVGSYAASYNLDNGALTVGGASLANFAATVTAVNVDGSVALQVLNSDGTAQQRVSVPIQQPDGPQLAGGTACFSYTAERVAYERRIYVPPAPPAPAPAPPPPAPAPGTPAPPPTTPMHTHGARR